MKKLVLIAFFALLALPGIANDKLAASMEVIGDQFKVLANAVQTQSFTADDLRAVQIMQVAIEDSAQEFPDNAITDADKAQYLEWMEELMALAIQLEQQGELVLQQSPQNMSDVTATLMAINELRKEAHSVFKPE
jgi:hypothetical protein